MGQRTVGMDLGTGLCSVGRLDRMGRPSVIADTSGHRHTPSLLLFEGSETVVGHLAKSVQSVLPHRVVHWPKDRVGDPTYRHVFGDKERSAEALGAILISHLFEVAQRSMSPIQSAHVAVPAHWSRAQCSALNQAAQDAGLPHCDTLPEPIAGLLGCLDAGLKGEEFLLVDMGAHTLSLAWMKVSPTGPVSIHTTHAALGTGEWEQRMQRKVTAAFRDEHGVDPIEAMASYEGFLEDTKRALWQLNAQEETRIFYNFEDDQIAVLPVHRDQLYSWTRDLNTRLGDRIDGFLQESGLPRDTCVVCIGGGARLVNLRHELEERGFTLTPSCVEPLDAIVLGATKAAALKGRERA